MGGRSEMRHAATLAPVLRSESLLVERFAVSAYAEGSKKSSIVGFTCAAATGAPLHGLPGANGAVQWLSVTRAKEQ